MKGYNETPVKPICKAIYISLWILILAYELIII